MKFFVNLRPAYQGEPTFVLHTDNWNDWYKWYTLFSVQAIMPNGEHVDLGAVKIARHGMTEQDGRTQLPQISYRFAPERSFSSQLMALASTACGDGLVCDRDSNPWKKRPNAFAKT